MYSLFEQVWKNKIAFFVTFFVVFTVSYLLLVVVDFLPEAPAEDSSVQEMEISPELSVVDVDTAIEEEDEVVVMEESKAEFPLTISIERLNKVIPVLNPQSRAIADLDAALLDGVVRHPDSATMTQEGNVFILGHSSYLPNVLNRNFQAFNGIEDLEWGDIITVTTQDAVYEYRVEKVFQARAQDVTVPIANTGNMLTLATCDSFGSVDDRFIVEAKQVSISLL